MKQRLGAILVREGVITPLQRDQALEAQILSGGRLGTNLVDMKLLTVDQVGRYLSQQHGLPLVNHKDLYRVPDQVVKLVPKAQCARYKVFPFKIADKILHLAMLDPNDLVAIDELNFLLGLRVQPYVVPQLRLLQVLEKRHGFMRERRFLRVPDEGEGRQPSATGPFPPAARISTLMPALPSAAEPAERPLRRAPTQALVSKTGGSTSRPSVPSRPSPVRPASSPTRPAPAPPGKEAPASPEEASNAPELVFLDVVTSHENVPEPDDDFEVVVEEPEEDPTEVVGLPPDADTAVVPTSDALSPESTAAPEAPRKEGPTVVVHDTLSLSGLKAAAAAMDGAEDRDVVIDLLIHAFRYQPVLAVLFLIRGEMAVGLASSIAIPRDEVRGLVLPLGTPSLLHEAFARQQAVQGTAKEDPLQQVIARYLRWEEPEEACVVPVSHGGRVINLLCVQTKTGTRFPTVIVDELDHLAHKAADGYVRLIQQHKRPASQPKLPQPVKEETAAPPTQRPALPDRRFFITGHVGKEGTSTVWRAIDTRNQRVVSITVMPVGSFREDQIARLGRMVEALGRLNSPNILLPLAGGTCKDGHPYLATEFVGTHTLLKRLEGRPVPPHPEVAEIVRQVGEAIAAAHGVGVHHGDLRPSNVLFPLPDKLQIKLAGFGMPRGLPAGLPRPETARYLAPEGLGPSGGGAPVDVYALAAMTFEMLGGKLPFAGESMLAPPELPPLLPGVPHHALNVLARGLAHHPEQRTSIKELAQELFGMLRSP